MRRGCLAFLLIAWLPASAQTLQPGDVALVGMNTDDPDALAFVALTALPAGTELHLTDNGWLASGSFRTGEGTLTYTAPAGGLAAGTVVVLNDPAGLALSSSGDQVLIYQGTEASPSFIYALNNEGSATWQADATSSNTSALPPGLTTGRDAVALQETDNIVYTGPTTGTCEELLATIADPASWSGSDAIRQTMPAGPFMITAPCSGAGGGTGMAQVAFARAWDLAYEAEGTPAGSYDMTVQVLTADPSAPTDFAISITGGSGALGSDVTGITDPTTVTIPAGSTAPIMVTLTVVDDGDDSEAVEDLVFTLNPSGSGSVGSPSAFRLWLLDDLVPETTLFPSETGGALLSSLVSAYGSPPTLGYDVARDTLYAVVDREANGDVCGLYSGWCINLPDGTDPSTFLFMNGSSDGINAEHAWPQSKGAASEPQRSNMHSLFPARAGVNSSRGNAPYGEIPDVETDTWFISNTSQSTIPVTNIDAYSEKDETDNPDPNYTDRFEPREAVEGNVARAMFYFYAMYESAATTADPAFYDAQKVDLYAWHMGDGVDAAEARRNVEVASYQGGLLNPFILDPTLVDRAFNPGGSLPVELRSLEAVADGGGVVLRWTTASETNSAGFEVEQRVGGRFQAIGWVEGAGTTLEGRAYSYRATEVGAGRHTFRLKQLDYDGAFRYSREVEVWVDLARAYVLSAPYPNPFNPATRFTLEVQRAQEVRVEVFDVLGRRVAVLQDGRLAPGAQHAFTFDAAGLPSGIYVVRAIGEGFAAMRRVVLMK